MHQGDCGSDLNRDRDVSQTAHEGLAGEHCGVLLRGINDAEVESLARLGSIMLYDMFKSEVFFLSQEERGREKSFPKDYCPQFHSRTASVLGSSSYRKV